MFYIKRVLVRLILTLVIMASVYFIRGDEVETITTYLLVAGIVCVLAGSFPFFSSSATPGSTVDMRRGFSVDLLLFNQENFLKKNPKELPPIGVVGIIYIATYWVLMNWVL